MLSKLLRHAEAPAGSRLHTDHSRCSLAQRMALPDAANARDRARALQLLFSGWRPSNQRPESIGRRSMHGSPKVASLRRARDLGALPSGASQGRCAAVLELMLLAMAGSPARPGHSQPGDRPRGRMLCRVARRATAERRAEPANTCAHCVAHCPVQPGASSPGRGDKALRPPALSLSIVSARPRPCLANCQLQAGQHGGGPQRPPGAQTPQGRFGRRQRL